MSLHAIIMAGGEGTRLRPLTCDMPKPLAPVLGRPVMSYALQLLARHNLREVGVTLQYLPEKISRCFGSGAKEGVRLHYTRERTPLGTAGGVLQAAKGRYAPRDTFVILSGDGLTDCDLTAALSFHREKKALATMVLSRVLNPLSYGVVIADDDGRVRRFVEKPGWGEVYSDLVNTGIYLLEPEVLSFIWPDKPCDFGRDLFPMLVDAGRDVFAYVSDGYWCDIGDQAAYVRAQADFLNGKVRLDAGPFIAETALVDEAAVLDGPCYIGPGARVQAHARLADCPVIGMNASIGTHARVSRSVLFEEASVASGAQVRGAVLCRGAQVLSGATVLEESALGDGAVLGARASLEAGAKVWPGKRIDPCIRVTENIVWDGAARPVLSGGGMDAHDPQSVCLLAASFSEAVNAQPIAIGHDGSLQGLSLYAAAQSALLSQGTRVLLLGSASLPTFRCAGRMAGAEAGLYLSPLRATLSVAMGGLPERALQRKIESLIVRQDYAKPYSRKAQQPIGIDDAEALHVGALSRIFSAHASKKARPPVALFVADETQRKLAARVLEAVQLEGRVEIGQPSVQLWETGFLLSATGERVAVLDHQGIPDEAEQTLIAYAAMPKSEEWIAPMDATAMLEVLAEARGARVRRVSPTPEVWASALLSAGLSQFDMHFDGFYRMLHICALLSRHGTTLRGLLSQLPASHRHVERVPIALHERGRLLRRIAENERDAQLLGGLRVSRDDGWLTINPDERAAEVVVVGEAHTMEAAAELCGGMVERILKGLER